MRDRDDEIFSVRDILDSQLMSHDEIEIGRVADIEVELHDDGSLTLTHVITGPQALAGRISWRLKAVFCWILRDRFEQRIPLSEIEQFGPTLYLHGNARDYAVGQSERWLAAHILRWIPGSGHLGK